jgi:hypothetical protein
LFDVAFEVTALNAQVKSKVAYDLKSFFCFSSAKMSANALLVGLHIAMFLLQKTANHCLK